MSIKLVKIPTKAMWPWINASLPNDKIIFLGKWSFFFFFGSLEFFVHLNSLFNQTFFPLFGSLKSSLDHCLKFLTVRLYFLNFYVACAKVHKWWKEERTQLISSHFMEASYYYQWAIFLLLSFDLIFLFFLRYRVMFFTIVVSFQKEFIHYMLIGITF